MTEIEEASDSLEDIQEELGKVVTDQSSRLFKHESASANITDRIGDLTVMMKEIQVSMGMAHSPDRSGQKTSKQIKLDLPKFSRIDPDRWIFQAEEYFTFHGILDNSRIQIVGFHMTKAALSDAWSETEQVVVYMGEIYRGSS